MSAGTQVSVAEYLSTSYKPDREYINGELRERNVGEIDHGRLQHLISKALGRIEDELSLYVMVETRTQVARDRFRIPDLCVSLGGRPRGRVVTEPPFLCIEILSPDDRMRDVLEKVDDYQLFGVSYVWLIDPATGNGQIHTSDTVVSVRDQTFFTRDPEIRLDLKTIGA
jgi:Uma2 family endonuclease